MRIKDRSLQGWHRRVFFVYNYIISVCNSITNKQVIFSIFFPSSPSYGKCVVVGSSRRVTFTLPPSSLSNLDDVTCADVSSSRTCRPNSNTFSLKTAVSYEYATPIIHQYCQLCWLLTCLFIEYSVVKCVSMLGWWLIWKIFLLDHLV